MKCEICGKESNNCCKVDNMILCSKHYHQYHSYGRFLDNIPRTIKDLNEYIINDDEVIFSLYNGVTSEKIGEFTIDLEDLSKFKYHKWRISHNHVVTGLPSNGTQRDASWIALDLDNRTIKGVVVDHIDGNPYNNKKSNLRIYSQKENVINKSFMSNNTSGFIGISYRKDRGRFDPEIRRDLIRCHLGYCVTLEEAVYKRLYAEKLIFGEFANKQEQDKKEKFTESLSEEKKKELEQIVIEKLKNKNLWQ